MVSILPAKSLESFPGHTAHPAGAERSFAPAPQPVPFTRAVIGLPQDGQMLKPDWEAEQEEENIPGQFSQVLQMWA